MSVGRWMLRPGRRSRVRRAVTLAWLFLPETKPEKYID